MKGNNILYVTWGEVIIENGIFKNQVMEQLKLIKQERHDLKIFLLSGVPLGNMKLLKRPGHFFRELKKIKSHCASFGISFHYRFILALSPWFYTPPGKLKLYDSFQSSFLKSFLKHNNISVVHCRSYTPTRLFLKLRAQKESPSFKIIFDTRGNFPEEGLLKSHINETDYNFWKSAEKQLFDNANVIVNVSETFTEYVKRLTSNKNIHTIYTSTNLLIFHQLKSEERNKLRKSFAINEDEKVLVYLGEISDTGWHQRSNLFNLYGSFKKAFSKTRLLLITGNPRNELEMSFSSQGFYEHELVVVKGRSQQEVNSYLNVADYAVLPFKKVANELDETLGYTMIASKTGEYLATGLPVIVNKKIGAASKLVTETGTGITYEMGKEDTIINCLHEIEKNKEAVIQKCIQASKLFDAQKNAEKYLAIYDKLLQER